MKVAVPVWNSRVSPVFDTSKNLLVVELVGGEEKGRNEYATDDLPPASRARRLRELGVDLLICGAVSNAVAMLIESAGIAILPWVSGDVGEVLDAFNSEHLTEARFRMPGCRRGRGGRRRGMRRAGARGFGRGRRGMMPTSIEMKEERDENSGNRDR